MLADTTNRAIQVSPVPGIFVGGVGLLCKSEKDQKRFIILTRDRKKFGSAEFNGDDINYKILPLKTTPDFYFSFDGESNMRLGRKNLDLVWYLNQYLCEIKNINDLHKAAEKQLRALLSDNKI